MVYNMAAGKWLEFVILVRLLSRYVVTSDITFCNNREEGHYADPEDCTFYYQCDYFGRAYHLQCPPGLVFSDYANACVFGICHSQSSSSTTTTVQPFSLQTLHGSMFTLIVKDSIPTQSPFISLYSLSKTACAWYCFSYSMCIGFSVYQQKCDLFKPPTDLHSMMTGLSGAETWCKYPCYNP